MRISLVVAMAKNRVIGLRGALPWRISDDLKWFKKTTLGKPVIMGRKTFESIGKPLPGRDNIVVTRSDDWETEGARRAASLDAAVALAEESAESSGADEICVIGGAEIYRQILGKTDRIYLTLVDAAVEGDAVFPEFRDLGWREERAGDCVAGGRNDYSCEFFILDRERPPQ